jgi:hypothetical protein
MNHIFFKVLAILWFCSCSSQQPIVKDLTDESEFNYVIANLDTSSIYKKGMYDGNYFVTIIPFADSKVTPEGFFEGSDEVLKSLLISIVPDGDFYTKSKLFKIEGVCNPKIIGVNENSFPMFSLVIEHGIYSKRITETFEFDGRFN